MIDRGRAADDQNLSPELKAALRQREERDEPIDVWPENWDAVEVFLRCQTQWRVGMAGATGLDYAGVDVALRRYGPDDPDDCFERVQHLETATLRIISDRRQSS
ncbi:MULTISPECIES: DUF1799 domain-containing protein [unclassified Thioalkalivibrio]|uniref:DUF1799 domain-containing protein n=1 Tax=unclassified Thioalkalivibrio TaxID=2621013 RepID=UPI0004627877|nr:MULTISPECIES: DUF1799 domain-containing protein [unclassified Thioalkalivibrio]